MKMCKFVVAFTAVAMMYVVPALAATGRVIETATDLGPNARPCSFAYMENSGWIAILRTDTALAHAMLILKAAHDANPQPFIGFQTGPGIGVCDNIPSLVWLND